MAHLDEILSKDEALKLELLRIVSGDVEYAAKAYAWITGARSETPDRQSMSAEEAAGVT